MKTRNIPRSPRLALALLAALFTVSGALHAGVIFIPILGFQGAGPLAATLGQTARLTVFNPSPNQPLPVRLTLFDSDGASLAQQNFNIPPSSSALLEVNADMLGLATGGRAEVMGLVRNLGSAERRAFVTLQIYDNLTGQTSVAE